MVSVVLRWNLGLTIPLGASCCDMISTFHPVTDTDRIQSLDIRVKIKSGEQQRREGKIPRDDGNGVENLPSTFR
jgi:hypothetical protein